MMAEGYVNEAGEVKWTGTQSCGVEVRVFEDGSYEGSYAMQVPSLPSLHTIPRESFLTQFITFLLKPLVPSWEAEALDALFDFFWLK